MRYSLTFLVLAVACVIAGLMAWDIIGWGAVLFLYFAVSLLLLAAAYAGVGPKLLLKRADGRQSAWARLVMAPYLAASEATFQFYRLLSREPAYVQAAPNLYFGRRLTAREATAVNWVAVLDLAAEFAEVRPLRGLPAYRSLPVLDTIAPSEEQLREIVGWLTRAAESGPIYVHCALGHGRSATVVIACLLATGRVASVAEGVKLLQSLRPGVGLYSGQRRRLRAFEPQATGPASQDRREFK